MAVGLLLDDSDARTAVGLSDVQYQEIQNAQQTLFSRQEESPEFWELLKEMGAIRNPDDPLMQNADEETLKQFQDIQERMISLRTSIETDDFDKNLTSKQKQMIFESQLASIGEIPFVTPNLFEVLNLTEAQKQQMAEIKKELEPEFEKLLEDFVNNMAFLDNKLCDEMEKQGVTGEDSPHDLTEFNKRSQTVQRGLRAKDPEYKRIQDEINTPGKAFMEQYKTKMFDVLTDKQWARLQELINNPPGFAKVFLKNLKAQRGESEKTGVWTPGPGSWQPGDPIPEQYRQERNTRSNTRRPFPREESP